VKEKPMLNANPGDTIIIILAVVILSQLLVQGSRHRKRLAELKEQLDRIEAKMGR
jgi:hypothetical protein